jgi:hypothetical protein
VSSATRAIEEAYAGYAEAEGRPLKAYAALVGGFHAVALSLAHRYRRSGRELPERVGVSDTVLFGIATHKAARLLTKDKVTSFVRAPFTEYQEAGPPGEVEEKARGTGLRLAVGELLTCPYCLGPWICAGFLYGRLFRPAPTRTIASGFVALTLADFLQAAYRAAVDRV